MTIELSLLGRDSRKYSDYAELIIQAYHHIANRSLRGADWQLSEIGDREGIIFSQQINETDGLLMLRQYAAYLTVHRAVPVKPVIDDAIKQQLDVSQPGNDFPQLLSFHSDKVSACFLPLDFTEPFQLMLRDQVYYLGSSPRLLAELNQLNLTLQVSGDYGENDPRKYRQKVSGDDWSEAKYLWGLLHWLSYESVAGNLALVVKIQS